MRAAADFLKELGSNLIQGAKDYPGISGPILAAAVGATIHGGFSLYADWSRRGWEDKRLQEDAQLKEAETFFQIGLAHLRERRFYEAEKNLKQAQGSLVNFCRLHLAVGQRSDISHRRIAVLANLSKTLFLQRKFSIDEKAQSQHNAFTLITEWLALSPMDRDAINLRGLIYLKQAYFDEEADCLEKALADFQLSLRVDNNQTDIYILLLFTQILLKRKSEIAEDKLADYYKTITRHITSGSDIFSNELLWIYAEAYRYCGDDKMLATALTYMKTAIRCTNAAPAFYVEKAALHRRCSEYYQRLGEGPAKEATIPININLVDGYQRQFQLDAKNVRLFATKHQAIAARSKEEHAKLQAIVGSVAERPTPSP